MEVNDVNIIAGAVDIRLHFRVPLARVVAEVYACSSRSFIELTGIGAAPWVMLPALREYFHTKRTRCKMIYLSVKFLSEKGPQKYIYCFALPQYEYSRPYQKIWMM